MGRLSRRVDEQSRLELEIAGEPRHRLAIPRRRTPQLLAEFIDDPATPAAELPRYLRAFDFLKGPEKERVLVDLAFGDVHRGKRDMIAAEAIQRLDRQTVLNDPSHAAALKRVVDGSRGTQRFVDLIQRFNLAGYAGDLVALAQKNPENDLGVQAVEALFGAA